MLLFEVMSPVQVTTEVCQLLDRTEETKVSNIRRSSSGELRRTIYNAREAIRNLVIRIIIVTGQETMMKKFKFLQEENFKKKQALRAGTGSQCTNK